MGKVTPRPKHRTAKNQVKNSGLGTPESVSRNSETPGTISCQRKAGPRRTIDVACTSTRVFGNRFWSPGRQTRTTCKAQPHAERPLDLFFHVFGLFFQIASLKILRVPADLGGSVKKTTLACMKSTFVMESNIVLKDQMNNFALKLTVLVISSNAQIWRGALRFETESVVQNAPNFIVFVGKETLQKCEFQHLSLHVNRNVSSVMARKIALTAQTSCVTIRAFLSGSQGNTQ